ncbi:MAG: metallophosphoesterase [Clostridia bacterium]|nr:metallophosphoesterase [Clostridia bacterium]
MKKVLSVFLALMMVPGLLSFAFAADAGHKLKFNDNGEFTIMHLCDLQDSYPMHDTVVQFVHEAIEQYKPDIVILGGDNTVCDYEDKEAAIEEICNLFVEEKTYFTLVFGNHDHQQGMEKEDLLKLYQRFGGEYCLAYDAVEELFGVGTHNLPIYASDGSDEIKFNLWMMDSNTYANDENGNEVGYDCVHEDQIEWYRNVSDSLKAQNGGEPVPSFVFQHICVQEVFDELFLEVPKAVGVQQFDKKGYSFLPLVYNIDDGFLFEFPCPGYYNYGQFDACVEQGDVLAMFFGHDHVNSYSVEREGIDLVCTAGCTYHSYGELANRGCRILTLNENNLKKYKNETVSISEMCLKKDSKLAETTDITKFDAFWGVFGEKFLNVIVAIMRLMQYPLRFLSK